MMSMMPMTMMVMMKFTTKLTKMMMAMTMLMVMKVTTTAMTARGYR